MRAGIAEPKVMGEAALDAPAPWSAGDVGRGIAAAVGVIIAALAASSILALGFDLSAASVVLPATAALDVALLWVAWRFTVHKYRCSWAELGFRPLRLEDARWAVPAGLFLSLAIAAVYGGIARGLGLSDRVGSSGVFDDASDVVLAGAAFMAIAVAPLVEETFFRGFLFRGLRGRLGFKGAAAAAAAIFALAHIQPFVYIPIFFIGWVLAWVYAGTGSLLSSILVHMSYNGLIIAVAFSA